MKTFHTVFTVILVFLMQGFLFSQTEDETRTLQIDVPDHIRSIINQVQEAENNEDWDLYASLRTELINAWQQVNPEVANLYQTVSGGEADLTPDGMPEGTRGNNQSNNQNMLFESPGNLDVLWGNDFMVFQGGVNDISMDISRDGDIYLAISGRKDGTFSRDSVYFYKSTNGGLSWTEWSSIFTGTRQFDQIEVMCFDGYPGSTGDSYLLIFYLFDNGWFRVGRTLTSAPSWSYNTIAGSISGGNVLDFAVDRNYPASNYRAICLYNSGNTIKSIRSEPTSNGTVWQDSVSLGIVGKDIDLCYGFSGATYVTFNGFNSGNLYVNENLNSGDPASWSTNFTLVTGSTDTTRHAEIIASRDVAGSNTVSILYELQNGTTYDIYEFRNTNGGGWGTPLGWVSTLENKWPVLYSRKENGNSVFRAVFEQSENGNAVPRTIRYKPFTGTGWLTSTQVSDAGLDVTGLQKPEVGDLDGNTAVYAFVGSNGLNVYFDNESWTPSSITGDETIPEAFSLEQNYPNPFNPSTSIQFRIPENSFVTLKVYDILGKEVANLINENKEAGSYEVNFEASKLSSGIYFYTINAGSFTSTKKMILMK